MKKNDSGSHSSDKRISITVMINQSLYREIKKIAVSGDGVSYSDVLNSALSRSLKNKVPKFSGIAGKYKPRRMTRKETAVRIDQENLAKVESVWAEGGWPYKAFLYEYLLRKGLGLENAMHP